MPVAQYSACESLSLVQMGKTSSDSMRSSAGRRYSVGISAWHRDHDCMESGLNTIKSYLRAPFFVKLVIFVGLPACVPQWQLKARARAGVICD